MKPERRVFRSMQSMRLSTRLGLGFGILLLFMIAVVVLAVIQLRLLAAQGDTLISEDLQRMLRVQEIHRHAQGHGNAMVQLLTLRRSQRERIYPIVDAEYASVERLLSELATRTHDATSIRYLDEVSRRREQYREVFTRVVEEIEAGDNALAADVFSRSGQRALSGLIEAASAFQANEQAVLTRRQAESRASIDRAETILACLAALAVVFAGWMAWRTTASVAKPLGRIEEAARLVAEGDYAVRIDVRGDDQLGRVAQAMNVMAEAVATREAEIENLAFVDALTGLPNRAMLRRMARARDPETNALILTDVARMRMINEVLGYETGDALLMQVADRLRSAIQVDSVSARKPVLARMPGGMFAVLCTATDRAEVEHLRELMDRAVAEAMTCDGQSVDVVLVHALARADAASPMAIDDLLRQAEITVTEVKRTHQAWAWHVAPDHAARASQLNLLSTLRSAAASGQLEMWLQPKQDLRTGRTAGMEALVRWRHPQRGFVSPAEFIPFAERTGNIGLVTHAMLDAALEMLASWKASHPDLSIAVNVSAIDIQQRSFVAMVERMAQDHGAPLDRLRLELTESSLMEDADHALPVLTDLRKLGVQWSIDDFGTGYSSLAYLSRLPVSELKIDRLFVSGADLRIGARELLRTIISLGHSLGMQVTAEGIERPEEFSLLRELGCDLAQGYLISRPMDRAAMALYLDNLDAQASGAGGEAAFRSGRTAAA